MSSLPRDVLKWVQGLDLTYSIKNTKRDLANGFLLAEILSKYYPLEFQMHGYDTGMGPAAKRNNWEQLQKACAKIGILLSKDLVEGVTKSKAEAGAIALGLLHHHVMKSGTRPMAVVQPTTHQQLMPLKSKNEKATEKRSFKLAIASKDVPTPIPPQQQFVSSGGIVISHPGAVSNMLLENDKSLTSMDPTRCLSVSLPNAMDYFSLDDNLGKVVILRAYCSLFGISDQYLSFGRSSFPIMQCREKLIGKFDSLSAEDIEKLPKVLKQMEADLIAILRQTPPSDMQLTIELLLPCIINFSSDTKVLHVAHILLDHYGKILEKVCPKETYSRLSSIKEFPLFIGTVHAELDKNPAIARIVQRYLMGSTLGECEVVQELLSIKAIAQTQGCGRATNGPQATNVVTEGSNCFLYLLCGIQSEIDKDPKPFAVQSQYTTLLLSESLTCIHFQKRAGETRQLFSNPSAVMEVCASLHIIASLAKRRDAPHVSDDSFELEQPTEVVTTATTTASTREGETAAWSRIPSLYSCEPVGAVPGQVAADLLSHERGWILRAIAHPECPSCLVKAVASVVSAVLSNTTARHASAGLARHAARTVCKIAQQRRPDECLEPVITMFAGVLDRHLPLCTAYAEALGHLPEESRMRILSIPVRAETWGTSSTDLLVATVRLLKDSRGKRVSVHWDVPFLRPTLFPRVVDSWSATAVGMGIARVMHLQTLEWETMLVPLLAVAARMCVPGGKGFHEIQQQQRPELQKESETGTYAGMFPLIAEPLVAAALSEAHGETAVNIMESFMRRCGAQVSKHLHLLVPALAYLHVAGTRKSRERLLKMMYRWATSGEKNADEEDQDGWMDTWGGRVWDGGVGVGVVDVTCLALVSEGDRRAVRAAMRAVLVEFSSEWRNLQLISAMQAT